MHDRANRHSLWRVRLEQSGERQWSIAEAVLQTGGPRTAVVGWAPLTSAVMPSDDAAVGPVFGGIGKFDGRAAFKL